MIKGSTPSLLLTTLFATAYLVFPEITFLLVPWALFMVVWLIALFRGGTSDRKVYDSTAFLFLLSGLIFVISNHRMLNRAKERWDTGYPEVIGELKEEINGMTRDHLESRLRLVSEVGGRIAALYELDLEPDVTRRHLFDLLERYRIEGEDRADLALVFSTPDGEDLAWSGDIYFAGDTGSSKGISADGASIRLYRGNIITAAIITYPVPGSGILTLYDHLDLEHHLSSRYSANEHFIDRLSRKVGTDIALYPADYQDPLEGEAGMLIFPLIIQGAHIGNWSVAPIAREGYIAKLRSRRERYLPLLLLIPWFLAFISYKRFLSEAFSLNGRSRFRDRVLYVVFLGAVLFLFRLVLLGASFPSSWVDGAYFSSRFFATGLFEEGSLSIGEFFISGLMISLLLLHVLPLMVGRNGSRPGEGKRRWIGVICGLFIAIILSMPSSFVLERLLRDSLSSMVIDQAFVRSLVTVFWEYGLFMLTLSLLLIVSICLNPAVDSLRKKTRLGWTAGGIGCLLFALEIAMTTYGYGEKWRMMYGIVAGCFVFIGGGLVSYVIISRESIPEWGKRWIDFRLIVVLSLVSAAFLYPELLRYRQLTLEETGEDLVEQIRAPYENWAGFVLDEAAHELMDRREEIFSKTRDPRRLGFYAWVNSILSRIGQRTALTIYDGQGGEISEFSLTDFEIDEDLSSLFLDRAREKDEPFMYHGFSRGREFYTAVVPYWSGGTLSRFLTVTLPADLEERLGGGPIRLFSDETDEDRWSIPEPMEVTVTSYGQGETGVEKGWESRRDEDGRHRFFRREVEVGGVEKVVEVDFRVQGFWESLSRVNFLFILHFGLIFILWWIGGGGMRGVSFRSGGLMGTFHKKLRIALIFFSVVPTLLIGIGGAGEAQKRLDSETRSKAWDGLESFMHLVERDLMGEQATAGSGGIDFYSSGREIFARSGTSLIEREEGLRLDSRYVKELARTIGQDFLIYRNNELVASSQEDLIQAGMIPRLMDEMVYVDLVLGKKNISFHRQALGNYPYLVANLRVTPYGAKNPIILATPMLWRQEEVDREVARLKYIVLMIIIGILFLASGVGMVVSSHLTRPIDLLKNAFERVGSGDFRISLEKGGGEEFDRLFESFEMMSHQLETSQTRLSEEKARLDGILQSVGAGIMAFGRDGTLKVVNHRAAVLIGEDLLQQVGRDLDGLSFVGPEWEELTRGAREVLTLKAGGFQKEFNVTRGEDTVTIRMKANVLTDESGEHQGAVIVFEDITDSIRSQKIMAWGEMARQVAHEIKNPLTPIRLSIQYLHRTYKDGAPDFPKIMDDEVGVILREIDRLRNIAGDFSRYAKPEIEDVRPIDIAPVIREIRELYNKEHGEITYSFELSGEEIRGLASEEGLKKVLVNLIENGRESIDGRGRLEVAVGEETVRGTEMVKIAVSDTGRGIQQSDIGRIFDPGFSTRSGGAGLGLAICKRIVEGWGGEIKISSRESEGTRVEVWIRSGAANP